MLEIVTLLKNSSFKFCGFFIFIGIVLGTFFTSFIKTINLLSLFAIYTFVSGVFLLFKKDKLLNVYSEELTNILKAIDPDEIPESYRKLVKQNLDQNLITAKQIKFDNEILHRSKVLKHFLYNNEEINRTEKDFKAVYKKIKKNKKYFLSIKDIIVLESLRDDGIPLPKDLDFGNISSQLTIPQNLVDLVNQNQTGLVMLKIVEIIGEDDIRDLDPETIYFLNRILI